MCNLSSEELTENMEHEKYLVGLGGVDLKWKRGESTSLSNKQITGGVANGGKERKKIRQKKNPDI